LAQITTDYKMLASTVQFSRYGQHQRPAPASAAAGPWPVKKKHPFPQDPTACPARPRGSPVVPAARRRPY
jgi:hypothetical protein